MGDRAGFTGKSCNRTSSLRTRRRRGRAQEWRSAGCFHRRLRWSWVQLPASLGARLLSNLCSLQIKCHWSLCVQRRSGTPFQKDPLRRLLSRFQLVPPHAHKSPSSGCWGSCCVRCTCCWQQREACATARTSARSWRRTARTARTEKRPRSGSTHPMPSFPGWESLSGCVDPERKGTWQQGGPTLIRSRSADSGGQWSAASQWPTSWSRSLNGCPSSGAKPWRCRCWWRTCGGFAGWSLSGGARATTPGWPLGGWRAETGVGSQLGTCPPLTPCDPGPCALT